ncbi:MAG: hypothetical protein LBV21_00235 [Candidatus Adiutrix sp.]|jgi:hypothetical protein|nr:hypothetical protein [Candidatus Adiutrix sp.]
MKKYRSFSLGLAALFLIFGPAWSPAEAAVLRARPNQARVGEITVNLAGPEGLTRVDGRNARATAYIRQVAPKLKLEVLALYADPGEWDSFVAAAAGRRPAAVPRFALICTTSRMAGKSYDSSRARLEFNRYDHWFSLAAGNRPLAALLTAQGNRKLTAILGANIGFEFKVDQFTKKFDQGSYFLSVGAKVSFNVFGRPADVFLTATALAVGDKLIFLGYFDQDGPPETIAAVQARAKAWRRAMGGLNADQPAPAARP